MPQTARPSFTAPSSPVAAQPLPARANPHINPFVDRPASAMAARRDGAAADGYRGTAGGGGAAASYAQRTPPTFAACILAPTGGRRFRGTGHAESTGMGAAPPQEESPAGHSGRRASASSAESDRSRSHDKKPSQYHFVPLVPSPAPDEEDDVLWKPPQLTRDALPRPSATVPKWRNRWQKARGQIKILMHWRSQVRRNSPLTSSAKRWPPRNCRWRC